MNISSSALQRIAQLLNQEKDHAYFRVYIVGGGCSGFQYDFVIEKNSQDDDVILYEQPSESGILKVVTDELSYSILKNSTLDFKADLTGKKFVVHNPLVKATCGCGLSFDLDPSAF